MSKQMAFHFDASACIGCKACQTACVDKNNLQLGVLWRRVFQYGGGTWLSDTNRPENFLPSNVFAYNLSVACNHCEKPICMEVCPTTAIHKRDDGIVLIDAAKCVGCRYCEWACPYGAPHFDSTGGVMTKCNFCYDLIDQGQNPACVDACVMRVLTFGELSDLRAKYGDLNAIEPLPSADITHPSLVITPHKNAQLSGQGTGHILNLPEEL